jgi:hypothetical protein
MISIVINVDPTALDRPSLELALHTILDMGLAATKHSEGTVASADGQGIAAHWSFDTDIGTQ